MANLKLYTIEIIFNDGEIVNKFVLAYNACHAVNLIYRYLDSIGLLNQGRHGLVKEHYDFISPNTFKDGSK